MALGISKAATSFMTAAAMIFSPISVCSFPRSIKTLTLTGNAEIAMHRLMKMMRMWSKPKASPRRDPKTSGMRDPMTPTTGLFHGTLSSGKGGPFQTCMKDQQQHTEFSNGFDIGVS